MNTKEPQCILFGDSYIHRTVYRIIGSAFPPDGYVPDITASGNSKYSYSFGKVSIKGTWYDVQHLEGTGKLGQNSIASTQTPPSMEIPTLSIIDEGCFSSRARGKSQ